MGKLLESERSIIELWWYDVRSNLVTDEGKYGKYGEYGKMGHKFSFWVEWKGQQDLEYLVEQTNPERLHSFSQHRIWYQASRSLLPTTPTY